MGKYFKFFNKWIYLLALFIFILLIFLPPFISYLRFDINAPDLGDQGENLRNVFFMSNYKFDILMFEFGSLQGTYLEIIIIIISFSYQSIKNKLVKYNIGKNHFYSKELKKLKCVSSSIPVFIFISVFLICIFFSLITDNMVNIFDENIINSNSILSKIVIGNKSYLCFYALIKSIAIFINVLFVCYLTDIYKSAIKASIMYLIIVWVISLIFYQFISEYFAALKTIMLTADGNISLYSIILPYTSFIIIYIITKFTVKYEVE